MQYAHARILAVTIDKIWPVVYEKLAVIVDKQSAQCTCYCISHSAEGLAPMVFIIGYLYEQEGPGGWSKVKDICTASVCVSKTHPNHHWLLLNM